jgi:CAAX protease family protein
MGLMFSVPSDYFIPAAFVSMSCMIIVSFFLSRYSDMFHPTPRSISLGILSAIVLYLIFYAGNIGIKTLHPFGMGTSSESAIYSLIANHALYIQVFVLLFDAVGYESYFRGILQKYTQGRGRSTNGLRAVAISALIDSAIHLISLNLLWVVTTFIADFVWGATYYYTKDMSSNTLSHLIWDLAIFIAFPIK